MQSAVTRLLRLPLSPNAKENEVCIIEQIARLNNLKVNVRQLIRRKHLRSILSSSAPSPDFPQFINQHLRAPSPIPSPLQPFLRFWLRLTYLGHQSDALSRELKKYGYRAAFYPLTQVRNLSKVK